MIDRHTVAEIIGVQFPELRPVQASYLGEGYDSTAFEVNGQLVFRFPKRADVEAQLTIETAILPRLGERTPVPVPAFSFHGKPSPDFPRHFVGYPKLPGIPGIDLELDRLQLLELAPILGEFLSFVHSFPIDDATQCGVPRYAPEALLNEVRDEAAGDLHVVKHVGVDALEEQLRTLFKTRVGAHDMDRVTSTLVHRDLAAEHILLDSGTRQVTGIIDWSEISISDPAIDFAGMFHWGGLDFTNVVLSHYRVPVDDGLRERARLLAAAKCIGDIVFGLETHRQEYIDSAVRALGHCVAPQGRM
ncbi:MAG TPA: phosphotransferase [Gemmatimonadaceae bacterium]|nr:phosphotransferase [Gemmatimonadaceae bacterium]